MFVDRRNGVKFNTSRKTTQLSTKRLFVGPGEVKEDETRAVVLPDKSISAAMLADGVAGGSGGSPGEVVLTWFAPYDWTLHTGSQGVDLKYHMGRLGLDAWTPMVTGKIKAIQVHMPRVTLASGTTMTATVNLRDVAQHRR